MREQLRERVVQVYEITCLEKGNAFLTENNLLITVKHVVAANRMDLRQKYKIMLDPGNGDKEIECEILTQDTDDFNNSTLVLLKPEKELTYTCMACDSFLTAGGMEVNGYINSNWVSIGIDSSDSSKTEITASPPHNEATNAQIALKNPPQRFQSLSGAPVVSCNTVYGVMIDEIVDCAGRAFRAHILCDDEYWRRRDILVNKLLKQEETMKKAEKPCLSFAEYVAKACDDRPSGLPRLLGNQSEYISQYPGQDISEDREKLNDFVFQLSLAANCIRDEYAREAKNKAIEILNGIYVDRKYWQDVYISALFGILEKTYDDGDTEKVKRLLDIAAQDLPHDYEVHNELHAYIHLFQAEYYISVGKYEDTECELSQVKNYCNPGTNCYCYSLILQACCVIEQGGEDAHQDVIEKLKLAIGDRPQDCKFYLTHSEVYRSLVRCYSKNRKFLAALECVKKAYQCDCNDWTSDKIREEDHKCYRSVCDEALAWYASKGFVSYGDWYRFYISASESPLYESYPDLEKKIRNKWIAVLDNWNCSRTELKSTDALEYALLEHEYFEERKKELQEFKSTLVTLKDVLERGENKNLILITCDIAVDGSKFIKQRDELVDLLCNNSTMFLAHEYLLQKKEDAYLYIFEYKPDEYGASRPPVWILICRK